MLYQHDWLDELNWSAVLLGASVTGLLQAALALLALRPANLSSAIPAVALVEVCVAGGACIAGGLARRAPVLHGLAAALASATYSFIASALAAPAAVDPLGLVFVFSTFAGVGMLGGWVAGRVHAID